MNNTIADVHLASAITATYYERLKKLSSEFDEDSEEFKSIVKKLHKAISTEHELYCRLTLENISSIEDYFKDNEPANVTEARIHTKIGNYRRLKSKNAFLIDDNILFSSVITSKLIIDVLKLLKIKINMLPGEEKEAVSIFNNLIKYTFLTANNFIERLANVCNYDVDQLPRIDFYAIEKKSNFKFMEYSQDLFVTYIADSIELLTNTSQDDDDYADKFNYLFELSRIEVMMPYLNQSSLAKIKEICCSIQDDEIANSIKKMIKKKEKDFE